MITIIGAGPAGCLLGILLARRGVAVDIYERRPDPRHHPVEAGRSINLALAARGIRALRTAGVMDALIPELVRMRGRMLHEPGKTDQFNAYGQRDNEVIWSVSRARLTTLLTEAASRHSSLRLHFGQQCTGHDGERLQMRDLAAGRDYELAAERIIGADGAGSVLRHSLATRKDFNVTEARLPHDYKELLIPLRAGQPPLAMDSLHIWPRGGFMLIALPNADGSFTATLFLARQGEAGTAFDSLTDADSVRAFFGTHFPDVLPLIPDLAEQFAAHRQGFLGTVYCPQWHDTEKLLLIGDAAHAIVPFHGQGMNCAFEDCRILDELLATDPASAFSRFAQSRRDDCMSIAQMALENYGEMRDAVRDPRFQRQKALSMALELAHPDRFIPRYAMVMFRDDIPYSLALQRGRIQQQILEELTGATDTEAVPLDLAEELISSRLQPLPAPVR
jgi:kynurenine 3-monooxygenase